MTDLFGQISSYNYWNSEKIECGIIRQDYIKSIFDTINTKKIKLVYGQRRTGKSYILLQLIKELQKQKVNPKNILFIHETFFINKKIKDLETILSIFDEYVNTVAPKGKIYLLFDKLDLCEDWILILDHFFKKVKKDSEIFVALNEVQNSLKLNLLSYKFEVTGFSFAEYSGEVIKEVNRNNYLKYIEKGSLPEVILNENSNLVFYRESLRNTLLLNELVAKYKVKEVNILITLFEYLCRNVGNLVSTNSIHLNFKKVGINVNFETIASYLEFFKEAKIFYELPRINIRNNEIIAGNRKFYPYDLIFLNGNSDIGNLQRIQAAFYLELRRNGYLITTGSIYGNEIDFIIERNNEKRYIHLVETLNDMKSTHKIVGTYRKVKDFYEKNIVSIDSVKLDNIQGVKHTSVWNFE